jgi:hypothetical protein
MPEMQASPQQAGHLETLEVYWKILPAKLPWLVTRSFV